MFPPELKVTPEREAQRLNPDPQDILVILIDARVNQEATVLDLGLEVLYHFEIS